MQSSLELVSSNPIFSLCEANFNREVALCLERQFFSKKKLIVSAYASTSRSTANRTKGRSFLEVRDPLLGDDSDGTSKSLRSTSSPVAVASHLLRTMQPLSIARVDPPPHGMSSPSTGSLRSMGVQESDLDNRKSRGAVKVLGGMYFVLSGVVNTIDRRERRTIQKHRGEAFAANALFEEGLLSTYEVWPAPSCNIFHPIE